jgi:hypothetical protein
MIHLQIPSLPPSSNHAYTTVMKGRAPLRILTKEGRRYQKETSAWLTQRFPGELAQLKPNVPYWAAYVLTTTSLYTKGWPDKAQSRYRKMDATNRVKLLEDVIAEVTGIDDSANMAVLAMKWQGPAEETHVYIYGEEDVHLLSDNPFKAMLDIYNGRGAYV